MFNIVMMTFGATCIGFGTGSFLVGIGVWALAFGFQIHFNEGITTLYKALIMSKGQ